MTTVIPPGELLRRALEWLEIQSQEKPDASKHSLLDEAGCRFNLGPLDVQWLEQFLNNKD